MRYLKMLCASMLLLANTVAAQWKKINDVDYVWGPFSIYNLALFSETGEYVEGIRPLMLTLKYQKPVDGRDFAISLARSWSNLGITLPEQDDVVDRLRKTLPNIKKGDSLSYIALQNKGYFVLNDMVIPEEFNQDFNNAVVAVWLDQRVEIGRALLAKDRQVVETAKSAVIIPEQTTDEANPEQENAQDNLSQLEQSIQTDTKTGQQAAAKDEEALNLGSTNEAEGATKPAQEPKNNAEQHLAKANENKPEQDLTPEPSMIVQVEIKPEEKENKAEKVKEAAIVPAESEQKKEEDSIEILPLHDFVDLTENLC
ncbi:pyruvate formate lyase-activating protein [Frederiksenia canicola]